MNLKEILSAELQFEQNDIETIRLMSVNSPESETHQVYEILLAAHNKDLSKLQEISQKILHATKNSSVFAFALQFALAGSEVTYDMDLRDRLLLYWNKVPAGHPQDSWYTAYLKIYSQALGAFFSGYLVEADHLFSISLEIANDLNYPRGQMRTLFHLGLVARDRGILDRAQNCFFKARKIALDSNAFRFLPRFSGGHTSPRAQWLESDLQSLLKARKWRAARSAYLKLERQRKLDGKNRYIDSYYSYLAILAAGFGKTKSYNTILSFTSDSVIKERIITLKTSLLGASAAELSELNLIRLSLGHGPVVRHSADTGSDELQIAGIAVNKIESEDVRNLLKLLANQEHFLATKETICRALWNLAYDPTIHDGRIYKLIHKCREITRSPHLIVNKYGSYQLKASLVTKLDAS